MSQAPHMKVTTMARRAVIVSRLELRPGDPMTFKQLLADLGKVHEAGGWPQASWSHARNDPYDVGLRQLLEALVRDGEVERIEQQGFYPKYKPALAPLRKHAVEVLALKDEGLTGVQIASRLGLSRSLVYALINDPNGTKERERKRAYCLGCGRRKAPEAVTCDGCAERKERKEQEQREAMLPQGELAVTILDTLKLETRAGCPAVVGVTPDFRRVIRWRTRRGEIEHQLGRNETWEEGMRVIGLWE